MYIVERLRQDYPQYEEEIANLDMFIKRYHTPAWILKIYDDSKDYYKFVDEAYKIGPGNPGYNRSMAYFEKALSTDKDYLQFFLQAMFDDQEDHSNMTVAELHELIESHYRKYDEKREVPKSET